MPLVGRMISRDPEAYDYLFKSTKKFHSPEALKQMFEAAGLTNVSIQPLSFGSVAIIAGRKPL
jgi:demethylmenaquinone methyltransferase/2-methoxy-6-polyprenyl-1,4-benzoquinol methylase